MSRPSSPNTRYFQRTLSSPQKQIMLAAGEGNLSRGFENLLSIYQHVHNLGYRPTMELSSLNIRSGTTDSPNLDDHLVDKVREYIRE
jgi:hypothetical protein